MSSDPPPPNAPAIRPNSKPPRVLAIASGGGHWQQLMLLRSAMDGAQVLYVTTLAGLPAEYKAAPCQLVPECNRNEPWAMFRCGLRLAGILLRFRPTVVITTGALPGLLAIVLAKTIGARTIWLDSIANSEELSMSGRRAKPFADLMLTQWPELAGQDDVQYAGSVL